MRFKQLKPTVPKCWLFVACALMWCGVGLMMCATGTVWLVSLAPIRAAGAGAAGGALALVAFQLGFSAIARKNIHRLRRLPERGCFFAFQAWQSYLIIAFMIALGITLRHSPVPRIYLAVVYIAIGGALLLGSTHYYRHLFRMMRLGRYRSG